MSDDHVNANVNVNAWDNTLMYDGGSLSQQRSNGPSGIAQLRKSIDPSNASQPDPMNLDEFIFPSSVASPAGVSPSPPAEGRSTSGNAVASAIPIKIRKGAQDLPAHPTFPPASVPVPLQDRLRSREFDYVQRHIRKTSIDERKVWIGSPEDVDR